MASTVTGYTEPLEDVINGEVGGKEAPGDELLNEMGVYKPPEEGEKVEEPKDVEDEAVEEILGETEEEAELEEVEGEEKEEQQEKPKRKSAAARIQQLVKKNKEIEDRASYAQYQFQQAMQQQQQQYQQQYQQLAAQNQYLNQRLNEFGHKFSKQEEAELTPLEKFKREAAAEARKHVDPEIRALRQELEKERRARAEAEQTRASKERFSTYEQGLNSFVKKHYGEVQDRELQEEAKTMMLAYCAATGASPDEAAERYAKFLERNHRHMLNRNAQTVGKRVEKSRKVAPTVPSGSRPANGDSRPSWDLLKKHGYSNYIEWRSAGSPSLQKD